MKKIIEAKGLWFRYGSEDVLSNANFSVYKGDFATIIGSNGAGKSTLLRLLLGEIEANAGSIQLFGQAIHQFKDWPKIGYVPQSNILAGNAFPATAEEIVTANLFSQVGLFRFPKKEHRLKVQDALGVVGMQDYAKQLIGNLSGGQQQRIMIARALVNSAEMLLLDEPVTGIDTQNTQILYDLLQKLHKEHSITIVMVTHDVARAANLADKVLCLEEGSIVELEKEQLAEELAHRHKHPHI